MAVVATVVLVLLAGCSGAGLGDQARGDAPDGQSASLAGGGDGGGDGGGGPGAGPDGSD